MFLAISLPPLLTALLITTSLTHALPTSLSTLSANPALFTLTLSSANLPALPLFAIPSASDPTTYTLIFPPPSLDFLPGTPAYLNTTSTELVFYTPWPSYAAFSSVGDDYGITVPILAASSTIAARTGFTINDDASTSTTYLNAKLDSAEESFFACNTTVPLPSEEVVVVFQLKWGVFNSNGSAPFGCEPGQLVVDYL